MTVQKTLGIGQTAGLWGNYQTPPISRDFVKNTFNFEGANPNRPYSVVSENALGDPPRGTRLYCLG